MKEQREDWKAEQVAGAETLDPNRVIFLDETWVSTNMTPRYGRCPRGERLVADVPHSHWLTITFVAALRIDGLTA